MADNSPQSQSDTASTGGRSDDFSIVPDHPETEEQGDIQSIDSSTGSAMNTPASGDIDAEAIASENSPQRQPETASIGGRSDNFSIVPDHPEAQEVDVASHHSSLSSSVVSSNIGDVRADDTLPSDDPTFGRQVRDARLMVPNPDEEFVRLAQDLTPQERREFNLLGKDKMTYVKRSRFHELENQVDAVIDAFCKKEKVPIATYQLPLYVSRAIAKRLTPGTVVEAASKAVKDLKSASGLGGGGEGGRSNKIALTNQT